VTTRLTYYEVPTETGRYVPDRILPDTRSGRREAARLLGRRALRWHPYSDSTGEDGWRAVAVVRPNGTDYESSDDGSMPSVYREVRDS
jgi:hypothetical protein